MLKLKIASSFICEAGYRSWVRKGRYENGNYNGENAGILGQS